MDIFKLKTAMSGLETRLDETMFYAMSTHKSHCEDIKKMEKELNHYRHLEELFNACGCERCIPKEEKC